MSGHETNQGGVPSEALEAYQQDMEARTQSHGVEKIGVILIGRSVAALEIQQEATGLTATDTINNALQGYGYIAAASRAGYDIILRDPSSGETNQVLMFHAGTQNPNV